MQGHPRPRIPPWLPSYTSRWVEWQYAPLVEDWITIPILALCDVKAGGSSDRVAAVIGSTPEFINLIKSRRAQRQGM